MLKGCHHFPLSFQHVWLSFFMKYKIFFLFLFFYIQCRQCCFYPTDFHCMVKKVVFRRTKTWYDIKDTIWMHFPFKRTYCMFQGCWGGTSASKLFCLHSDFWLSWFWVVFLYTKNPKKPKSSYRSVILLFKLHTFINACFIIR